MKAILLIDHGSRRDAANEMMDCMANLVQAVAGPAVVVRYAHMEIAEPSIASGVRLCVEAGATELIVFPYMLSPGKHSTGDIPRLVAAASAEFPALEVRVTNAFGVHEKLAELILERAGLPAVGSLTGQGSQSLLAFLSIGYRVRRRMSLPAGERSGGREHRVAVTGPSSTTRF